VLAELQRRLGPLGSHQQDTAAGAAAAAAAAAAAVRTNASTADASNRGAAARTHHTMARPGSSGSRPWQQQQQQQQVVTFQQKSNGRACGGGPSRQTATSASAAAAAGGAAAASDVVVQHDVVPLVQWGRGMTHRLSRSGDSSKVSSAVSMPACHVLMPLFCTAVTSSACRHTTTMRGRGMMVLQRVMPRLTHRCTCYTVTLHSCRMRAPALMFAVGCSCRARAEAAVRCRAARALSSSSSSRSRSSSSSGSSSSGSRCVPGAAAAAAAAAAWNHPETPGGIRSESTDDVGMSSLQQLQMTYSAAGERPPPCLAPSPAVLLTNSELVVSSLLWMFIQSGTWTVMGFGHGV